MRKTWVIGTSEDCDIRLASPFISGIHCRLSREGTAWFIEDLDSRNGTFVNGSRVAGRVAVSRTDAVTLGQSQAMPWPPLEKDEASSSRGHGVLNLPTDKKTVVIGRSSDCDIVIPFPMVSGRHAELRYNSTGWRIRDLDSSNGTYVGSRRVINELPVRPGDTIGLGSHQLVLSRDVTVAVTLPAADALEIEAASLTVHSSARALLEGVSCVARPGELIAIMGPSGAGKSTLLSALVGMSPPHSGRVLVAGMDIYEHPDFIRGAIGYVPQDDIMHADLTVAQALWYSARLRLPSDHSDEEIRARVERVIGLLGLQGTEATRIGSAARRGISGGQRKRVNIALELLTDPSALLLDEPTSGLSSSDAASLVRLLRSFADSGKTVILTIHQPSIEILKSMSALAVIARDASSHDAGRLVWFGPAYPDAAHFFEPNAVGDASPDAEAVLRGLERHPVHEWVAAFENTQHYREWVVHRRSARGDPARTPDRTSATATAGLRQLSVLVRRMLALKRADRVSTGLLLLQSPLIGLLIVLVLGKNATSNLNAASWPVVSSALSMTSFLAALSCIWFGCSNAIREIVAERTIYRRERMAGVGMYPYICSKIIVLGLISTLQCAVLLAIVAWGCALGGDWMEMFTALTLAANVGVVIALCASALVRTPDAAATLLPLITLPLIVLGGALLPVHDLSPPMALIADLMPSRWAFEGVVVAEADSRACLEVPDPTDPSLPRCHDIAERFFPAERHRTARPRPVGVLLSMWLIGLAALRGILRLQDR